MLGSGSRSRPGGTLAHDGSAGAPPCAIYRQRRLTTEVKPRQLSVGARGTPEGPPLQAIRANAQRRRRPRCRSRCWPSTLRRRWSALPVAGGRPGVWRIRTRGLGRGCLGRGRSGGRCAGRRGPSRPARPPAGCRPGGIRWRGRAGTSAAPLVARDGIPATSAILRIQTNTSGSASRPPRRRRWW